MRLFYFYQVKKFPNFKMNDRTIFWAGAITMYGYPLLGWSILTLKNPRLDPLVLIYRYAPLLEQLLFGYLFGLGAYLVIHAIMFSGLLSSLTKPVQSMAKQLNWVQIVFLSLAAGFGEELLFRGVIQLYWGIWPTAILFVAIHGYLNITDIRVFAYGVFMVVVSAGFGYLYVKYGIGASIMAHFLIDLLIFGVLKVTPFENLSFEPIDSKNDRDHLH